MDDVRVLTTSEASAGLLERAGHGSLVMAAAAEVIERHTSRSACSPPPSTASTNDWAWQRWQGPAFVIDDDRRLRTEDEDDGVMALRVGASLHVPFTDPIACRARSGDDW